MPAITGSQKLLEKAMEKALVNPSTASRVLLSQKHVQQAAGIRSRSTARQDRCKVRSFPAHAKSSQAPSWNLGPRSILPCTATKYRYSSAITQLVPLAHLAPISAAATITEQSQQQGTAGSLQVQRPAAPKVTGNTVVLTGGSQGVGRATALLFARNSYNVVIAARNPDKLQAAEADLSRACSSADAHMAVSTDITDEAAVQQLVEAVTARYEIVTTLINCAGVLLCVAVGARRPSHAYESIC